MRYPSIDILRTVAIFVMVLVHFSENLSGVILPITGLGAPLFAILAGASYRLWSSAQFAKGKTATDVSKISVRRGLFVFGIGFAFNILVWLPEDTFNWDVLTFIGASLLLLNFLRRLPPAVSVVIALAAIVVAPVLRVQAEYALYWENGYFEYDATLADLAIGFFATGYFPFFPWVAYPLTGYVAATALFAETAAQAESERAEREQALLKAILLGAGLMICGLIAFIAFPVSTVGETVNKTMSIAGWNMFPPSPAYVLTTIGIALFLLGTLHRVVDRNPDAARFAGGFDVAKTFSRYSLTIYILHHLVHIWPLWICGMMDNPEDPTIYWQKAMPLEASVSLAIVFLVVCYVVFRRIGSNERYGIESWMRWLCD